MSEFWRMPSVSVNLMCEAAAAENDPFYERVVRQHFLDARRRRPGRLFLRQMVHGVALSPLPSTFEGYYRGVEGSARRNHKKAVREGCEVRRIDFNDHLEAVAAIRASAPVRQGRAVPQAYLDRVVRPHRDPPSRSPLHDYPYLGVFLKARLIAYCGALVAGEYAGIEQIFGHAECAPLGAVPLLIIGLAEYLYANHPAVKHYAYGTYFGAKEPMRRFKRKFGFHPHRVDWVLGRSPAAVPPATYGAAGLVGSQP